MTDLARALRPSDRLSPHTPNPCGARPGILRPAGLPREGRFLPAAIDEIGLEIPVETGLSFASEIEAKTWVRDAAREAQARYADLSRRHRAHVRRLAAAMIFVLLPAVLATLLAPGMPEGLFVALVGMGAGTVAVTAFVTLETLLSLAAIPREFCEIDTQA